MTFWLVMNTVVNLTIHHRGEPKYCWRSLSESRERTNWKKGCVWERTHQSVHEREKEEHHLYKTHHLSYHIFITSLSLSLSLSVLWDCFYLRVFLGIFHLKGLVVFGEESLSYVSPCKQSFISEIRTLLAL